MSRYDLPFRCTRRRLLSGAALMLSGCGREPQAQKPAAQSQGPVVNPRADWLLTPGAPPPDWTMLDAFQEQITRADFERLLLQVTGDGAMWPQVELLESEARIRMATPREGGPRYTLRFAPQGGTVSRGGRYWRALSELPSLTDRAKPLSGLHIVLDPGHIGGAWAQMEERWFQPANGPVVKEGELTLRTARVLAPMLEALGAKVSYTRTQPAPATDIRPEQLMDEARAGLVQERRPAGDAEVRAEAERLFYRAHEIRARGRLVNDDLRPDMVICLHFNADGSWGNPLSPFLSPRQHLHVLAHGAVGRDEAMMDDQRLDALLRLAQRIPDTEIPLCAAVAKRMAAVTGLPPFIYHGSNARQVPGETFLWTRNLLANRIYRCPVVFCEPWVMNNAESIARFAAGDYEGTAEVAGKVRPSIFREYATGVAEGLREFFSARA